MPDDKFASQLRRLTMGVEGVRRIEELGVHRLGPYFNINMTIAVDGHLTVEEGNRISDAVEKVLMKEFEGSLRAVHIHYHPLEIDSG
jgi:divalent metal cation (Fe/Co/Zn/Cd) transporter